MKINFLTLNPNENIGSYRIWVRDLSRSLVEIGHKSNIFTQDSEINDLLDCDTVIFCKSAYYLAPQVKAAMGEKNVKLGGINVARDFTDKSLDFLIVGSPEEMCSLSHYDNVFIYPLIERQFENVKPKYHKNEKSFRICFHGHHPHLAKFEPFLRVAIEKLSEEIDVTLVVITGEKIDWKQRPKNTKIEMHQYDINTVTDIIKSCDVGVVPNVFDIRVHSPEVAKIVSSAHGLYDTDYFIRFKNKTNGGRGYVFYQHGIPVIHDISPSSFDFMSKTGDYIFAHDENSWKKNLRKMTSEDYRNKIAEKNYNQFNISYNPLEHAKNLVNFIESV